MNVLIFEEKLYISNLAAIPLNIYLYSLLEKFLKETWVVRHTMEKSAKILLKLIDDLDEEIFIISA